MQIEIHDSDSIDILYSIIDLVKSIILDKEKKADNLLDYEFSQRTRNLLYANKITTIEKLTLMYECQLKRIDGVGKTTMNEIHTILKRNGLKLQGDNSNG